MQKISSKFKAQILVADDYIVNQELTKEMLEMMDCDVDVAEDGSEALRMYEENEYDLLFLDIQMPEKDGYELTREIRKREGADKHTTIIAVTANALVGDREKCIEAGTDDYISKPIKGVDLQSMLEKYLSHLKISV